jgi:hypothetical protein
MDHLRVSQLLLVHRVTSKQTKLLVLPFDGMILHCLENSDVS